MQSHDGIVTRLVVPLALRGDQGISLDEHNATLRAETAMSDTATAAVPATYSVKWLDGNGDQILDPGEHALMTVDLPQVRPSTRRTRSGWCCTRRTAPASPSRTCSGTSRRRHPPKQQGEALEQRLSSRIWRSTGGG